IPRTMPALLKAHKVSNKAAKAGFDWNKVEDIIDKVHEEVDELKEAIKNKDQKNVEEEIGDILFSLVNVSRYVEVNPEEALRKTIGKFIRRFHYVEKKIASSDKEMCETELTELNILWDEAKKKEQLR
ncbi:MAG: hypothetical protein KAR06_07405, partial [Deltaproteobacteria bacterium]|nr:hypothetical protein [Deltaproteobacteria bacterium]